MAARRPPVLLGRAAEREVLDRLLENVRGGQSAVLVVRGEAGVGKTALLHYCARQASGFRVARIAGVESEMELPFAGLHQLCAPMLGRLDALPEPQQAALGVALGLSSGDAPDRFLVALAALSLLAAVAAERPLLCLVDDAQWLDGASGQVLGFVARRLLAESVAIVFAVREPTDERELTGLPELHARRARGEGRARPAGDGHPGPARRARPRPASSRRRAAIRWRCSSCRAGMSRGGAGRAASGSRRTATCPGGSRRASCGDSSALPEETRRLLLVAAAEPVGDAAARVARGRAARHRALCARRAEETEGLLDDRRAGGVPPSAGALGGLSIGVARRAPGGARGAGGGDRRERRRGPSCLASRAAAPAPDEEVAVELERSAGRARARGGLAAAAAFLRALGRADARPRATRRPRAGGRASQACTRARSTRRSSCWPPRRRGCWTSSSAPGCDLLRGQDRVGQRRGARLRRSC